MPRYAPARYRGARWCLVERTSVGCRGRRDESEYIALAEIVNELRFLRQVKAFVAPLIDYNIRIHEDNEGAIRVAENRFSSRRRRNIDVKHHMVRDAVDGGIIRVEYVKS